MPNKQKEKKKNQPKSLNPKATQTPPRSCPRGLLEEACLGFACAPVCSEHGDMGLVGCFVSLAQHNLFSGTQCQAKCSCFVILQKCSQGSEVSRSEVFDLLLKECMTVE